MTHIPLIIVATSQSPLITRHAWQLSTVETSGDQRFLTTSTEN